MSVWLWYWQRQRGVGLLPFIVSGRGWGCGVAGEGRNGNGSLYYIHLLTVIVLRTILWCSYIWYSAYKSLPTRQNKSLIMQVLDIQIIKIVNSIFILGFHEGRYLVFKHIPPSEYFLLSLLIRNIHHLYTLCLSLYPCVLVLILRDRKERVTIVIV